MTFSASATLQALKTQLTNPTAFPGGVQIGEPFAPVAATTLAIFGSGLTPSQVTLNGTIDVWEVTIRVYAVAGMTPADAEAVELSLADGLFAAWSVLAGGFTLSSHVRAIDWAGEEAGGHVAVRWGHIVISGTIFRVVDITLPLIVDDAGTFAA